MDYIDSNEKLNELIKEKDMLLVYFGNNTCGVCTDLKPKVKDVLKKYPRVHGVQVNVEESLKLAASYDVFTIPVIILFIEGKEVIREARHIGVEDIDHKIERYYKLLFD